ncbi:MAG: 50S ribosomal protein L9 [Planctomycetota bacterium]|nr:50S ribosomal protein L9 [Planctomycetota bacterium]
MAMEVLLRRTIEGVGDVGEIVKVKPGFARNYLLPKGYAARVSPDAMRRIERDKEVEAKRQAELSLYNAALVEKLGEMELTVEARAGEDGHLYGSVTSKHVIAAFIERGYEFQDRQIVFEPVREIGEYEVMVRLSREHESPVKLWVVQDARDIESLKARALEAAEAAAAEEAGEGAEGETPAAEGETADAEPAAAAEDAELPRADAE